MEVPGWAVAAAVLTAAAGLVTAGANALRSRRDARREDQISEPAIDASYRSLYEAAIAETARMRQELAAIRAQSEAREGALGEALEKIQSQGERIALLESMAPFAMLSEKLRDWQALRGVLNRAREPWVISSPADEGRLLFVNDAFAALLSRTPGEILALGWRSIIHPEDLRRAMVAEGQARYRAQTDTGFVARYATAAGEWRQLRWWVSTYDSGVALSLVHDDGILM